MGKLHGFEGIVVIAGVGGAFVKGHDNVGADDALDIHDPLGAEHMFRPVDVRLENDALFLHFPAVGKRIHLVSAAVGKYGFLPAVEFMQSPGFAQNIQSRPEVKVIGVA